MVDASGTDVVPNMETSAAMAEVSSLPTLEGLKCKARISKHKDVASDTVIAQSIVDDVLTMSL